jgi:hypothetical protein
MTLLVKGVIEPEGYKEPEERLKEELERKKALEEERKKKHAEEKQLKLGRKVRDYIKKLPSDELEALTEQAIKQLEQPMQEALKSKKTDDLTKSLAELNLKVQMEIVIQETVFKEEI